MRETAGNELVTYSSISSIYSLSLCGGAKGSYVLSYLICSMFETAGIADNNHSSSLIGSSITDGGVYDCEGFVWLEILLSVHQPGTYIISYLCLVSSCSSQIGNMY